MSETSDAIRGAPATSSWCCPRCGYSPKSTPAGPLGQAVVRERISMRKLAKRFGFHPTTFYRWYEEGSFPRPHFLADRRFWFEDEIAEWEAHQSSHGPRRPNFERREDAQP